MTDTVINPLPQGRRFGVIYADPPWSWKSWGPKGQGRSAVKHYPVLDLATIKAMPVANIAAPDCALFLWTIDTLLPQALQVIEAWGFTFKTVAFSWVKLNPSGEGYAFDMGYWTRGNPEQCLLATRGHPRPLAHDVRQLIVAPRRAHSAKPLENYDHIERLVAGPYAELFSRCDARPGWMFWGERNEETRKCV